MSDLGIRMRLLRKKKQLSQKEVAEALEISYSAYNMYEKGKREPNISILQKIADYFKVTLDDLVGPIQLSAEDSTVSPLGPFNSIKEYRAATQTVREYIHEETQTVAVRFDSNEFTLEELEDIKKYAEFVKSKRKE